MRLLTSFFVITALLVSIAAAEVETKSLEFDGETYYLAHTDQNDSQMIEEFVRKQDTIHKWQRLLSIRRFKALKDSRALVKSFVDALKEQNAKAPYDVQVNKATGEILFDFVVWAPDGSTAEFNVWKFKNTPEGVVGYQFAIKSANARTLMSNLQKMRTAILEKMADAEFTKE